MTLSETTEYRVSAKGFNAVKRICSKITNQDSRRRAFKALLCMDTLADYLYSQGFDIDISKNLYKILPLNEEFEFTDIHCNGRFINVVPVVNGQYVLIPKNHTIFDVVPELYVVADYNQTTKRVKFLGCFEGEKIPKNVENGSYYVCNIKNIQPPAMVDELLSSVKPEELSETSHGLFISFFVDYLDGVLDDTSKKRLITHLIECKECRSELVEFFDYEMIAKETKNFPDVLADNTLDIVGAVAVNDPKYKDYKEYTIQIEKQKDEYEEDEEENAGGKQIKSAIEDPLQILYGKNKNKQIFDLMGDRPKKQSILDSVMSDISKSAQKETKQALSPEEMNVSYEGVINPEYYAEGLPEGTDTEQNSEDLKLDIDSITNLNKEDDEIFEIVEEDNDVVNLDLEEENKEETEFLSDTKIPKSLKSDIDEPKFTSQLNASEETKVSVQDEMILLEEEKEVDEPEFISQIKPEFEEKLVEETEYDNLISVNRDDEDLSILEPMKAEDDLPISMDGVVFYDNEEEGKVETLENSEEDNLLTLLPGENSDTETSLSDFNLKEDFPETVVLQENLANETDKDDLNYNSDDMTVIDENSEEKNVQKTESQQIVNNFEFTEDALTEDDIIHFDAVDIDIVNEEDIQYLEKPSIVPSTIEDAGIAASSLINDYEDETKEIIAKKLINSSDVSLIENELPVQNVLDDSSVVSSDNFEKSDIGDLLIDIEDDNYDSSLNTNSVSQDSLEEEFVILDSDEDADSQKSYSIPTKVGAEEEFVNIEKDEDDDLQIIDDNAENDDFIIIDEDTDSQKSYSIPTKVGAEEEFVNIEKDEDDDLQIIDDNAENDDFIIIDEDTDSQKSYSIPTKVDTEEEFVNIEKVEDDDLQIIDDNAENDDSIVIDNDFEKPEEKNADKNTNSVLSLEDKDDKTDEDLSDDFLDSLPMINKEEIQQEKEQVQTSEQMKLEDDESNLLSFDEDNSNLLNFDNEQDLLLSDESEPFVLEEATEDNDVQNINGSSIQQVDLRVGEQDEEELTIIDAETTVSDFGDKQADYSTLGNEDKEEEDLVIIDDKNSSDFADSQKGYSVSENTVDEEDEDEDIVIIDDEGAAISTISDKQEIKTDNIPDFEPVSDDLGYDDSVNFFRPAGASFDYDNTDFDNNFTSLSDEKTEELEDIQPISDIEDQTDVIEMETEEKADLLLDDTEVLEEDVTENEQEDEISQEEPQKPVSQLDLIFKSLSSREKEQIDAIQSGTVQKEEEKELPKENVERVSESPRTTTMFKRNFKDAIAAKDEAVEDGRISLKPSSEPIVNTLINTTALEYDEDDYEEVYEEEEQETAENKETDETEHVEYVYEDEDGNEYIPEDGEEVEYVYEDEDGNIIDEGEVQPKEGKEGIQENAEELEELQEEYEEDNSSSEEDVSLDDETEFTEESDDEQDETDEEEQASIEETEESEESEEEDISEEDEDLETQEDAKKKSIIKKSIIAAAVAIVLIGGGITTKVIVSHSNANAGQEALNAGVATDETVSSEEEGGLTVPEVTNTVAEGEPVVGSEEGGLAIPESDAELSQTATEHQAVALEPSLVAEPTAVEPQVPASPKAGTPNATTSDMNKAVANAFSETPSSMTVRKASWGVGATLAADTEFKAYLQRMGKLVKANLKKSLASVRGEAPTNPVKVQIKMSEAGVLQDVIILKSSGNSQVDEIVLQSVKQTSAACPFPKLSENTLKANNQATGGNTVKMSLTVTF